MEEKLFKEYFAKVTYLQSIMPCEIGKEAFSNKMFSGFSLNFLMKK